MRKVINIVVESDRDIDDMEIEEHVKGVLYDWSTPPDKQRVKRKHDGVTVTLVVETD